jgi:homoserine kinase
MSYKLGALKRVTVYAPGSASNLGPGFDCLGIAFTGRGDRVTATSEEAPGVRVGSVSDSRIPLDASRNTAAIAASSVLRRAGAPATFGLRLDVLKGLPLSGGMGGSAASAVGGAVAADALLGSNLSREDLLGAALDAEAVVAGRHADNVAPSLYGGAVLVVSLDPLLLARVRVHASLALVLASPDYQVETSAARAVLPGQVGRADAVLQSARLGALVLGLERAEAGLIRGAMVDLVAEPARQHLYPGFAEARRRGLEAGAFGVVVSGAGPTVVAITPAPAAKPVAAALEGAYRGLGIDAQAHCAEADDQGARVVGGGGLD